MKKLLLAILCFYFFQLKPISQSVSSAKNRLFLPFKNGVLNSRDENAKAYVNFTDGVFIENRGSDDSLFSITSGLIKKIKIDSGVIFCLIKSDNFVTAYIFPGSIIKKVDNLVKKGEFLGNVTDKTVQLIITNDTEILDFKQHFLYLDKQGLFDKF